MNRFRKTLMLTALISLPILASLGAAVRHFGSGPIGAAGTFVTTITKTPYQLPASVYFSSLSQSFTSSAESLLEQTVTGGSKSSPMVGATGGSAQMIYCYSPSLDGTLGLYGNTAGTGSVISGGSVAIVAGTPYMWDYLTSGTTNSLALTSTNSLVFTAGTTASGGTTSNTSSSIIAVGLYP